MSLDEFWNGNPQNFFIYKDLYIEKKKQEEEEKDYWYWLQGQYTLRAFEQVMQNSFSKTSKQIYPKEPLLKVEQKKKMNLEEQTLAWIERINKQFEQGA